MKVLVTQKKGVAIVVVLVFCTAILGLITVLLQNTRAQRGNKEIQEAQTKALLAAKAATQLAIYKYRVLPSEFYRINTLELKVRAGTANAANVALLAMVKKAWMDDFDSKISGSPASLIKIRLDQNAGDGHNFGLEEFSLVSSAGNYAKDFLKIRAWGSFGDSHKVLEELIEVKIVR